MSDEFIFLVGPMGAGKSTIGRHLASVLHMPFIDTDQLIEDRSGADIPWIFDVEGEAGFRQRESRALADICDGSAAVVATGGGIVMDAGNRSLISRHGQTVYLYATLDQQMARTAKDRSRPLLQNKDPEQVLKELIELRDPLYRELADIVYPTDNRTPRATASEIARQLQDLAS